MQNTKSDGCYDLPFITWIVEDLVRNSIATNDNFFSVGIGFDDNWTRRRHIGC